mmetsp:Transcript_25188/g.52485  ORF Transcript_25188/g.52485 Transcript_25188/m.52485 type:complete len:101 (-) Transcript_25188:100-402(-)
MVGALDYGREEFAPFVVDREGVLECDLEDLHRDRQDNQGRVEVVGWTDGDEIAPAVCDKLGGELDGEHEENSAGDGGSHDRFTSEAVFVVRGDGKLEDED